MLFVRREASIYNSSESHQISCHPSTALEEKKSSASHAHFLPTGWRGLAPASPPSPHRRRAPQLPKHSSSSQAAWNPLQIYFHIPENSGALPFVLWSHPLSSNLVPDILTRSYVKSVGDPNKDTGPHPRHAHAQMLKPHTHTHTRRSTNPEDSLYLLPAGLGPWLSLQMFLSERLGLLLPRCPPTSFSMTPASLWWLRRQSITPPGGRR